MDHDKRNNQRPPTGVGSTMHSSSASSQARQLARNKGLAWVAAITLGAGAASALGAGVIAVSLPSPSAATTVSPTTVANSATTASSATTPVSTSTNGEDDDAVFSQQAAPVKAAPVKAAPLKAAAAPTASTSPPVATTAAS